MNPAVLLRRFDIVLGRIPTYRLVAACRAIIAVIALVASLTVGVGYPPKLLTGHFVLTVGTTWLGSRPIGAVIEVRTRLAGPATALVAAAGTPPPDRREVRARRESAAWPRYPVAAGRPASG